MFVKRLCFIFLLNFILIYLSGFCQGETGNLVSVRVPEICRYRIDEVITEKNHSDLIQQIKIAILSNSTRPWCLIVYSRERMGQIEWSKDKRVWNLVKTEGSFILAGNRSNWENHFIFFRYDQGNHLDFQIKYVD